MSSHNHEPIYNQEDMDGILKRLRDAQKEAEQLQQLLWAVVYTAGGEVAVPHSLWLQGSETREVLMWDDAREFKLRLKIRGDE